MLLMISIVFSFLCSLWEAALLSITPMYAQIQQQEGGLLITLANGAVIFLAGFVDADLEAAVGLQPGGRGSAERSCHSVLR